MESKTMDIIEMITKARVEAIKRGIQANSIIIGEHLRYIKPFAFIPQYGSVVLFPPMIMGMEIKFSNQLPNGADFAIFESEVTEREQIIMKAKAEAAKEFADYARKVIVKQFSDTEIEKIKTVGALQLLYNKIEELYGVDV